MYTFTPSRLYRFLFCTSTVRPPANKILLHRYLAWRRIRAWLKINHLLNATSTIHNYTSDSNNNWNCQWVLFYTQSNNHEMEIRFMYFNFMYNILFCIFCKLKHNINVFFFFFVAVFIVYLWIISRILLINTI